MVKKVVAIVLALNLLFSYIGFSMSTHFCGGAAVQHALSFGQSHLNCGMAVDAPHRSMEAEQHNDPHHDVRLMPKPCCENQHQLIQLEDDFKVQTSSVDLSLGFAITYVQIFLAPFLIPQETKTPYTNYIPPRLKQDTQVLFQSFLI